MPTIPSGNRNKTAALILEGLLWLTNSTVAATACAASAAIGANYGWNYQSVEEQYGNSEDEQKTFHLCFLLVTADWTVIFSWPRRRVQRGLQTLERSEFVTR